MITKWLTSLRASYKQRVWHNAVDLYVRGWLQDSVETISQGRTGVSPAIQIRIDSNRQMTT
jgi:hypothetical protein